MACLGIGRLPLLPQDCSPPTQVAAPVIKLSVLLILPWVGHHLAASRAQGEQQDGETNTAPCLALSYSSGGTRADAANNQRHTFEIMAVIAMPMAMLLALLRQMKPRQ